MDKLTEENAKKILKVSPWLFVGLLVVTLGLVLLAPFLFIWAVNVLFGLSIKFSLINWLAAAVVLILFNFPKN